MNINKKLITVSLLFISLLISSLAYAQTADGGGYRWWRGQSSELEQKINALDRNPVLSVYIPILFGVELRNISPNFGDLRSGGRTHEGEDIMGVSGTPIVSPTQAVVIRTGVGPSEGNYVYTANPGGETFVYMHLDTIGEGVTTGTVLEKGSLIGYVGNTGNAIGGAAHLHFEIHDNTGKPIDPYPRITSTFTLGEKIQYLTTILNQNSNSTALAQLLVTQFRQTFTVAVSSGITLPQIISNALSSTPNTNPPQPNNLPVGDLTLGSQGQEVVRLQQFLITKNTGPLALRLSYAGATGNFGPMTQAALQEFQTSVGISPANGFYGASTRVFVESNTTPPQTSPPVAYPTTLTRNLSLSATGEDVRTLQKFLNTHGFMIAEKGPGSPDNETTYFGNATKAAVIKLQIAYNISPSLGYVGVATRAKITALGI